MSDRRERGEEREPEGLASARILAFASAADVVVRTEGGKKKIAIKL